MAQYRVLTGIDYPPNKRAEAGDVVTDLPAQSVKWLLESGVIEDTSKPSKKVVTPKEEPKAEPVVEAESAVEAEPVIEAKIETKEVAFDPDAKDGDGDGFVQDGTPHQRPVEEK
jgi:hypothetical protein